MIKPAIAGILCVFIGGVSSVGAADYSSYDDVPGIIVTGVRSNSTSNDNVILTASYKSGSVTYAALYSGSLAASPGAGIGSWSTFLPQIGTPGNYQDVTNATLYGPNTSLFSSTITSPNIRAVGSYKYNGSPSGDSSDHGLLYNGPTNGSGTFTQIDANPLVAPGLTLRNTIAHSTMGDLVVGNYNTIGNPPAFGELPLGNAFIYNMSSSITNDDDRWVNINPFGAASMTAYGIWQNSETSYTIAGGFSDVNNGGIDMGYLLNYDTETGFDDNYATFNFSDAPVSSLISHFDGITVSEDGFNLTGDYIRLDENGEPIEEGGFFATVTRDPLTGDFGPALWTDIVYPESGVIVTSGNTIVGDNVLGVYEKGGEVTTYLATVPEPSTWALLALGAGLVLWRVRAARRASV